MREKLIPTRVINKNGVATTVHKKPSRDSGDPAPIPAPLTPPVPRQRLSQAVRKEMIGGIGERVKTLNDGNNYVEQITKSLSGYTDDTVIAIHEYLKHDFTDMQQIVNQKEFITQLSLRYPSDSESAVRGYLTYIDSLTDVFPNVGFKMVGSLHQYEQLPAMDDYSDADSETKVKVSALLTLTSSLYKGDIDREFYELLDIKAGITKNSLLTKEDGIKLDHDDLTDLVLEYPDQVDDIVQIIVREGVMDPAFVRERITSSTPSLRNGLL